jgi:uncharacterized protein (DUF433 family)
VEGPKRKISAEKLALDVHDGLSDQQIIEKYSLSSRQLYSLLELLVKADLVTQFEVENRSLPRVGTQSSAAEISSEPVPKTVSFAEIIMDSGLELENLGNVQTEMTDEILKRLKEGVSDQELMVEFKLTSEQLTAVFDMLVTSNAITSDELKTIRRSANWDSANFRPELESGTPDRRESSSDFDKEEKKRRRIRQIFYIAFCMVIGLVAVYLLKTYSAETIYNVIESYVVDPLGVVREHGQKTSELKKCIADCNEMLGSSQEDQSAHSRCVQKCVSQHGKSMKWLRKLLDSDGSGNQ